LEERWVGRKMKRTAVKVPLWEGETDEINTKKTKRERGVGTSEKK